MMLRARACVARAKGELGEQQWALEVGGSTYEGTRERIGGTLGVAATSSYALVRMDPETGVRQVGGEAAQVIDFVVVDLLREAHVGQDGVAVLAHEAPHVVQLDHPRQRLRRVLLDMPCARHPHDRVGRL